MRASAAIYGCEGPVLSPQERAFFREAAPWGYILFARNIETPEQVRRLVADLREAVGRDAPVLIDQEGGRVARLKPPHWRGWGPALTLAEAERLTEDERCEALALRYEAIARELSGLGIDVDCAPLLDVPAPDGHDVIGDRALGRDPASVARRGRAVCEGLMRGGVRPVIKHIPGHGRATADSHLALPVVDTDPETLRAVDFPPFKALSDMPMAMTAHVVYSALDPENCATLSPAMIRLIREEIGFGGLLMTDDLSMHALSGDFSDRVRGSLTAGCDVVLHCNGDPLEMASIAAATPDLTGDALRRAEAAAAPLAPAESAEIDDRLAALAEKAGLAHV